MTKMNYFPEESEKKGVGLLQRLLTEIDVLITMEEGTTAKGALYHQIWESANQLFLFLFEGQNLTKAINRLPNTRQALLLFKRKLGSELYNSLEDNHLKCNWKEIDNELEKIKDIIHWQGMCINRYTIRWFLTEKQLQRL